jgi:hypothetical protein
VREVDPQDEVELAFNQGIQAVSGHWYNKIFRRISKTRTSGSLHPQYLPRTVAQIIRSGSVRMIEKLSFML